MAEARKPSTRRPRTAAGAKAAKTVDAVANGAGHVEEVAEEVVDHIPTREALTSASLNLGVGFMFASLSLFTGAVAVSNFRAAAATLKRGL